MRGMTDEERRRRLVRRHLLLPEARADVVEDVVEALVALHASDPASVFLATCVRMSSGTIADVERALYDDRTIVRHHAMRRTLWVMTPEVARMAHAGFTSKIARAERARSATLFGCDEAWFEDAVDRVVATVEAAKGPIGTREVGKSVPDLARPIVVNAGRSYEGTMAVHTRALLQAAFEGRIVRARPAGSWTGSQYAWVANDGWLAIDWSEPDELAGATEVVRRWLDRFGPGTVDDIVWWTGSTKGTVRSALDRIETEQVGLDDGNVGFILGGDDVPTPRAEPSIALLPGLDPTAMGWKQRTWYLAPEVAARVTDRSGNIGPTVWVDGRIAGGWVQRPDGTIVHDARGLTADQLGHLGAEVDRLCAIVGDARFRVRFPSPIQPTLLA